MLLLYDRELEGDIMSCDFPGSCTQTCTPLHVYFDGGVPEGGCKHAVLPGDPMLYMNMSTAGRNLSAGNSGVYSPFSVLL